VYACLCRAVTEQSVREVVAAGASTVSQVRATCGAGTGCGGCLPSLRRLLRECQGIDGLACTSAATLDPYGGFLESTCSGNCADRPQGEPLCVAGLGGRTEADRPEVGVLGATIGFA
jgi:bacterioferritin-associated ferredoxin